MNRKALAAYAQGGLEASVVGASPHQLVLLLMDGVLAAVRKAGRAMQEGQYEEKGKAIIKAVAILEDGLSGVLDVRAGGELAANLDALYQYCVMRLWEAHQDNDLSKLKEVERLFEPIRDAWYAISQSDGAGRSAEEWSSSRV